MKLNAICHNCFEFVFPVYWHFENGVRRVSEDVLLDPDGLPHVLALAVPLLMFLSAPVHWIGDLGLGDWD